ncbi:MAG: hypothetical protein APF84_10395 [Gracilibacter sp. BRH_c7a]|nr:MAG: hypothetical protein APF84_10395 [Gracilibacter sp. BRH_c7a]
MRLKQSRTVQWLILLVCVLTIVIWGSKDTDSVRREEVNSTHPSFVTGQELNSILAVKTEKQPIIEGRIVSMVVPHHLVASRLLVQVMEILVPQQPTVVIVIGPNHYNSGGKTITGLNDWLSPNGVIETEANTVKALLDKGLAVRDEETLSKEHSIGALVPLLKHYLPETKIVPIILHHDVSLQEVDGILQALEPFLAQDAVVISSVDFSHYLTRSQAQAKDEETLRHMNNFDYPTIFRLGNDYLDSPASLAAAFRLAEKRGIKEFTVLDNTNSGIIMQNDFIETTSYFTLVFHTT